MLDFYGEDTEDINSVHGGVRRSWDNGRNVDLNDQFQSGSPVTAFLNLNSQKKSNFIKKIDEFRRVIMEKPNFGLISVSEIIAGLCYKNVCV
jgi:hypothetical protein